MGFAQEVKDFLSAWQAGEKINASRDDREYRRTQNKALQLKTETENDPARVKLADDTARARLGQIQASTGAQGANTALTRERIQTEKMRRGMLYDPNSPLLQPQGSGLLPTGGALPIPQMPGASEPSMPAIQVPEYQEGGLVEDDEVVAAGEIDDDETGAIPTDVSAQSRSPAGSYGGIVSSQLINDAARAGLQFGHRAFGLNDPNQMRTAQGRARALQYMRGAGGLTEQEMRAVGKAVDKDGKLSESERNIAALGSVYQYQLNKGNPEGAQRVAFQMLQHYRAASMRYASIAAAAAQGGNMDMAVKAATRAYANIPDGRDFDVVKQQDGSLAYTYTDTSSGKVLSKGIASPQQLVGAAMGLAQGGFDQALMRAAGAQEAAKKGTSTGNAGAKPADRKTMQELAMAPVDEAKTAWDSNEKNKGKPAPNWGAIGDLTTHFMQDNPRATPREAFRAAEKFFVVADPKKEDFKVKPIEGEEGMSMLQVAGGPKLRISNDALDDLVAQRAAAIKASRDKPAPEETKWGEKVGAIGEAIGKAGSAYVDRMKQDFNVYRDSRARAAAKEDSSRRIASPPPGDVESQRYQGVLPPF